MPRHRKKETRGPIDSLKPPALLPDATADGTRNRAFPGDRDVFTLLAENTLVGFYIILSGRFVYINDRLADVLGYVPAEMVGKRVRDFLDPEHQNKLECWSESGKRQGKAIPHYECRVLSKTGETKMMEVYEAAIEAHGNTYVMGNAIDITDRRRAEEALEESVDQYRTLVERSPYGIGIASEGRAVYVNPALVRLLRASTSDEILGKLVIDFVHPDYRESAGQRMAAVLLGKAAAPTREEKLLRLDGSVCEAEITAIPFSYEGRPAIHVVFSDITERRSAEEKIKASLKEKEILLREIHHRVKNNLQIVCSLLRLEAAHTRDRNGIQVLNDIQSRVRAMALVHETLHQSGQFAFIGMSRYVQDLVNVVEASYGGASGGSVKLRVDVEDVSFGIDTALPCGLVINELVSNALKHAFGSGQDGEVFVGLKSIDEARFELTVADNGKGITGGVDVAGAETLGLRLVRTLGDQLAGEIQVSCDRGTQFKIRFRELKPGAR